MRTCADWAGCFFAIDCVSRSSYSVVGVGYDLWRSSFGDGDGFSFDASAVYEIVVRNDGKSDGYPSAGSETGPTSDGYHDEDGGCDFDMFRALSVWSSYSS